VIVKESKTGLQVTLVLCCSHYTWLSDVTVICGHNTISMSWDNTAYCVKISRKDLSRYSDEVESVGLSNCPYYHYFY